MATIKIKIQQNVYVDGEKLSILLKEEYLQEVSNFFCEKKEISILG